MWCLVLCMLRFLVGETQYRTKLACLDVACFVLCLCVCYSCYARVLGMSCVIYVAIFFENKKQKCRTKFGEPFWLLFLCACFPFSFVCFMFFVIVFLGGVLNTLCCVYLLLFLCVL